MSLFENGISKACRNKDPDLSPNYRRPGLAFRATGKEDAAGDKTSEPSGTRLVERT